MSSIENTAAQAVETAKEEVAKVVPETQPSTAESVEKTLESAAHDARSKIQETVSDIKKESQKLGENILKAEKEVEKKIADEYNERKGPVIEFFKKIGASISGAATYIANTASSAVATTTEELKNPVVAGQSVLSIGAIAGLVVGIQERTKFFKSKSDAEITAILAGLVALVAIDGYVFSQLYPKYKKSLKK